MNIIVNPTPIATATLDVAQFAALYRPVFDLHTAGYGSVQIVTSHVAPAELLAFIYHGVDWSNVLLLWTTLPPVVELRVHAVMLHGLTIHKPGVIDPGAHTLTTEDHVIDKADFVVIHTGNPRLDKHLEYLMAQNLIEYGEYEWNVLFDVGRSGYDPPVR